MADTWKIPTFLFLFKLCHLRVNIWRAIPEMPSPPGSLVVWTMNVLYLPCSPKCQQPTPFIATEEEINSFICTSRCPSNTGKWAFMFLKQVLSVTKDEIFFMKSTTRAVFFFLLTQMFRVTLPLSYRALMNHGDVYVILKNIDHLLNLMSIF